MATEKRLIDANALIDEGYKVTMLDVFPNWLLMSDEAKEAVCKHGAYLKKIIQQLPTVDAEHVKHGYWISLTDCSNAGVYCSVCHKKVWKEDYAWCNRKNKLRSNYCPHCGAKMDQK